MSGPSGEGPGDHERSPVGFASASGSADLDETVSAGTGPPARGERQLERGTMVGRYSILEHLGSGAMGTVFAAFDPALDRRVALKILHHNASAGAETSEGHQRLAREAKALARLDHPNVVTVHDVGTFEGRVYTTMELVDGETLGRWLAGEPAWPQILEAFLAAGEGLAAAHEAGLVHRDFKPDNVMVAREPSGALRVRVMDFGLAHAPGATAATADLDTLPSVDRSRDELTSLRLTRTGAFLGTPAYMAPEQFAGAATTAAADQFSFCVALYEALLGERPFSGDDVATLAFSVTAGQRRPVPHNRLPRRILAAIDRGLALDPVERWPSMRALLSVLRPRAKHVRGWATALGLGTIAVVLGVALAREEVDPCPRSPEVLRGTWDADGRARVEGAILGTNLPYAEAMWEIAHERIDPWIDEWQAARVEACRATHVRHEQSEAMLDRRIVCLDQRLDEIAARVETLTLGDPAIVERTRDLTARLPPLAACEDVAALAAAVPPPEDPEVAAEVEGIRSRVRRAIAIADAARPDAALEMLDGLRVEALRTGYLPILGEVDVERGRVLDLAQRTEASIAATTDAVWTAHTAGDDRTEARASTMLVGLHATARRFEDAERWMRHARADVERVRDDVELRARLAGAIGKLAMVRDRFDEAIAEFTLGHDLCRSINDPLDCTPYLNSILLAEQAAGRMHEALAHYETMLGMEREALGPSHPEVGKTLTNMAIALRGVGRLSDAQARLDEAIAIFTAIDPKYPLLPQLYNNRAVIALYEDRFVEAEQDFRAAADGMRATMGEDHPGILGIEGNVAMALLAQGRFPEALETQQSVLARTFEVYGENSMEVADAAANVGDVLHAMERFDEAAAHYERALAIREALGGPEHIATGRALCNLGAVERALGRNQTAITHYERCLAVTEKSLGAEAPQLAKIEAALGDVLFDVGRRDEGMIHLQRGLEIATRAESSAASLAQIQYAVGRRQWENGVDRAGALDLVRRAQAAFAAAGGRHVDEAEACASWLKTHRL